MDDYVPLMGLVDLLSVLKAIQIQVQMSSVQLGERCQSCKQSETPLEQVELSKCSLISIYFPWYLGYAQETQQGSSTPQFQLGSGQPQWYFVVFQWDLIFHLGFYMFLSNIYIPISWYSNFNIFFLIFLGYCNIIYISQWEDSGLWSLGIACSFEIWTKAFRWRPSLLMTRRRFWKCWSRRCWSATWLLMCSPLPAILMGNMRFETIGFWYAMSYFRTNPCG